MSNSPLVSYVILSPFNYGRRDHDIDTVSIHSMAGNIGVKTCGNIFQTSRSSSNYGIDSSGKIALYVDEDKGSWCTSSRSNDMRAVTIEVANDGGAETGWHVSDKAYKSLINLLVDICKRNNIKQLLWRADKNLIGKVDKQNMTVHRWFAAKSCPGDWLYERHYEIAAEVNKRLMQEGDEDMDAKKFHEMWLAMRKELQDNDASDWSKEAREWAFKTGIIAGGTPLPDGSVNGMWQDMLTREQLVTVLYRFAKLMGMA